MIQATSITASIRLSGRMGAWLTFVLLGVAVSGLGACSGKQEDARTPAEVAATENPSRDEGRTEAEKQVLAKIQSLAPGRPTKIGSVTVTAREEYAAASGHLCRSLTMTEGSKITQRLACQDESNWYFVPSVLASPRQEAP